MKNHLGDLTPQDCISARIAANRLNICNRLSQGVLTPNFYERRDANYHHNPNDRHDDHQFDQREAARTMRFRLLPFQASRARWRPLIHQWAPMFEVIANIADNTLMSRKPTPIAITMINTGSIMFVMTRNPMLNSFSYVSPTFFNAPGTSPVSSPILTRSTISCGKILLRPSGCAMVLPSVTSSRVLAIASFTMTLEMICSVIFNAVRTGTPFSSSVESVRAN